MAFLKVTLYEESGFQQLKSPDGFPKTVSLHLDLVSEFFTSKGTKRPFEETVTVSMTNGNVYHLDEESSFNFLTIYSSEEVTGFCEVDTEILHPKYPGKE